MAQQHKAYVAIMQVLRGDTPGIGYSVVIVNPDNTCDISVSNTTGTSFSYGDSNEAIRQAIVAKVRADVNDPSLDVNFVTG